MATYQSMKRAVARLMYKDTMTVYRVSRVQADDGSDDYEESETPVLSDVPCKLSQYGKDLLMAKTAQAATVHIDLRVCCAPDIDIREQDHLMVKHQGQTFNLFAGTRFAYPTHQEISVRSVREAKQNGT